MKINTLRTSVIAGVALCIALVALGGCPNIFSAMGGSGSGGGGGGTSTNPTNPTNPTPPADRTITERLNALTAAGLTEDLGSKSEALTAEVTIAGGTAKNGTVTSTAGFDVTINGNTTLNNVKMTVDKDTNATVSTFKVTSGTLTLENTSELTVNNTGKIELAGGTGLDIKSGAKVTIGDGSEGTITVGTSATVTVSGTLTIGKEAVAAAGALNGGIIVKSGGSLIIKEDLTTFETSLGANGTITLEKDAIFTISFTDVGGTPATKTIVGSGGIFDLDTGAELKLGKVGSGISYTIAGQVTLTQNLGTFTIPSPINGNVGMYPIQGRGYGSNTDALILKDTAELIVGGSAVTLVIGGDLTPETGAKISVASGNAGQSVTISSVPVPIGGVFVPVANSTNTGGLGTSIGVGSVLSTGGTKTFNGSVWN